MIYWSSEQKAATIRVDWMLEEASSKINSRGCEHAVFCDNELRRHAPI